MRERMLATLGIWAAAAFSVDRLLAALRYTVWTEGAPQTIPGTTEQIATQIANIQFVDGGMQIAIFVILFIALCCAMGATIVIWESAKTDVSERQAVASTRESEKIKRTREMRVKRLLSVMDEEELAELEAQHLNEDEMTVAQLMQQKRSTREM